MVVKGRLMLLLYPLMLQLQSCPSAPTGSCCDRCCRARAGTC